MRNRSLLWILVMALGTLGCHNIELPIRGQLDNGAQAPVVPRSGKNLIGINLNTGSTDDFSEERLFADAMKQARAWFKGATFKNGLAALDSNLWPTEDASLVVMHLKNNEGTYHCSFEGTATVSPGEYGLGGIGSIQNQVFHPDTGRTTFEVVITKQTGAMSLAFTGTTGGIRDLKIMRPKTLGSSESYPEGTLFTDQILALVSKFQVIRFMDYFRTNGNPLVYWKDRPLPTDASFSSTFRTSLGAPLGGCYEYAIALCNQTKCDLWLNIPLYADDDFVRQLATLVKDGGNGYPGLDPSLNVYVEYSNEVWNTGGGFPQGNQNHDLAVDEEARGDLPSLKTADPSDNPWFWANRRVGRRLVQISDLFREVWGDASMPAPGKTNPRVRPVFSWQQGTGAEGSVLAYLDLNYRINPPPGYQSHPINWYFYGTGGSGYYNPDDIAGMTLAGLWTSWTMSSTTWRDGWARSESTQAKAFGLKRIAYEGGPSFDKDSTNDALRATAWADPYMEQNLVDHVDVAWNGTDSDLFVFYAAAGDYRWGFTQDIFQLNTPKLRAIDRINSQGKAPVTVGPVPPCTVNGSDFDNDWYYRTAPYKLGTDFVIAEGTYVVYAFRTVNEDPVTLTLGMVLSLASFEVFCDGVSLGVLPAASVNEYLANPAPPMVITGLKPGLHTIMIRSGSAGLRIHSLTFTP